MAPSDRPDPDTDPFRPPVIPTEVRCLHCGKEYQSYLIEWVEQDADGEAEGFWCCPTPGCSGKGFGFDLLPTDPEYVGEDGQSGWFLDDSDEDEDDYDDLNDLKELDELTDLDELDALDHLNPAAPTDADADSPPPPADVDAVDEEDLPW